MMNSNVSMKELASREECLNTLGDFIETCQDAITSMLDTLGWTPEHFMQPKTQCQCPYNRNHRMTKSTLEKHEPVCELVSQGYSHQDAENILEDRSFMYKDASCVYTVKPDLETVNSVLWNHHVKNHSVFYGYKKVAQTPEEEQSLMSREDRLAMAEYIIRRAKEANRLKELGQDELLVSENLADLIKKDTEERTLDPVEEMAALRDYRRRRQTYRAKNVHITKKSHTEIMREVINNQMEMYEQTVKEQLGVTEHGSDIKSETDSQETKSLRDRDSQRAYSSRDRGERSGYRESRMYSRSRSRSRDKSDRPSRRSRSRSRDRGSGSSRYRQDDRTSVEDRSLRDDRDRSPSQSDSRDRAKHKHKHRSRSRSRSSDRHKKSKHKKHKHKHKKHKKSGRTSADRGSEDRDVKTEPGLTDNGTNREMRSRELDIKVEPEVEKT